MAEGSISVLTPLRISLQKFGTGEQSRHENRKQVQSRMRLAGSMCKCRARAGILHIGICGSEQERGPACNRAVGPQDREEGVLRGDRDLPYPAALHTACRNSDHRQPDADSRAQDDRIKQVPQYRVRQKGALPGAAALLSAFCFCFPSHQSTEPCADLFDRMFLSFAQQVRVPRSACIHFPNKFAGEFS